jgi:hypothetical protein
VEASADDVVDQILQDALERAQQRKLACRLAAPKPHAGRPTLQAAFCIDVRSEVFRRALEASIPASRRLGSPASSACPWRIVRWAPMRWRRIFRFSSPRR